MDETTGARTFGGPAEGYDRFVGRYSGELAGLLADAADPLPGQRALDVGCGPGALTAELAARLGVAHVAAVDPSPSFADTCRHRLPGVDVRVAPAEDLPFADAVFDVTLAQLVVNFMTDQQSGVREMVRVTHRGGTVGAAVWDYAGEMTLLRTFWDAAAAVDPSAGELDEGRRMQPSDAASLGRLWTDAGLSDVRTSEAVVSAAYADFDDLWQPLETGVGPAGAHVSGLDPDRRDALRTELRRRLGVGDSPFRLTARAWLALGTVAG